MDRRKYLSASVALLTAGVAGCSQSTGDATPTDESTSAVSSTPTETSMGTQLQYEGDTLTLDNATGQEIRGTTDMAADTTFDVAVDSTTAGDPFVKRASPTATDDGTFSATVDMSDVDDSTTFEVRVNYDGETLAEADGRIA